MTFRRRRCLTDLLWNAILRGGGSVMFSSKCALTGRNPFFVLDGFRPLLVQNETILAAIRNIFFQVCDHDQVYPNGEQARANKACTIL